MELTVKRGGEVRPAAERTQGARAQSSASALTERERAQADRLELSRQALAYMEEQRLQTEQAGKAKEKPRDPLMQMLEQSDEQAKGAAEAYQVEGRCQKIAARIMSGDRVPLKDQRYLMEKSPELYKMAMLLKRTKKDPKDCDSVVKDEEERDGGAEAGGAPPAPEAAPAPETGGEEA